MKKVKVISLLAIILALIAIWFCWKYDQKETYVVMLSLDGFRWDYPEYIETPNLDYIAKKGVKAEYLRASFPTKTFPNHYSMATGLYPDHHGIVLNSFYAPKLDDYYTLMDRSKVEDARFYDGEPIWVTAEKQGVTTASFYWVGSEAPIKGIQPTYWKEYDHSFPFEQRIDTVIAWLQLPEEKRPNLITFYMDEPDGVGHKYGPESQELINTVIYLDSLVGIFINKVEELPNADEINIIVTSDHGMGDINDDRIVRLEEHLKDYWFKEIQGYNPNFIFQVKEDYLDSIQIAFESIEHVQVWESSKVPERFHYGSNPRTLDYVMVADSSWSIVWEKDKHVGKGAHGYDNMNTDMHAIFYAKGPEFKRNYEQPPFNNIDIYPLIASILDLEPAPVDGKLENVSGMLK
jgi:alkaline phosphatase D